jgi:hypothetical protein
MSRKNAKEKDLSAYAGKIINLAEFNLKQYDEVDGILGFIKAVLRLVTSYSVSTAEIFKKAEIPIPLFYVTKGDLSACEPPGVSAQNFYFEASSVMSVLQCLGGKRAVSHSFRRTVDRCIDHRYRRESGQLTANGGEANVHLHLPRKVKPLL